MAQRFRGDFVTLENSSAGVFSVLRTYFNIKALLFEPFSELFHVVILGLCLNTFRNIFSLTRTSVNLQLTICLKLFKHHIINKTDLENLSPTF